MAMVSDHEGWTEYLRHDAVPDGEVAKLGSVAVPGTGRPFWYRFDSQTKAVRLIHASSLPRIRDSWRNGQIDLLGDKDTKKRVLEKSISLNQAVGPDVPLTALAATWPLPRDLG